MVECNFDREALEALSPDDQRRADALESLFELLEDYPVEDADDSLVHATLARVDRCEEQRASRMAFRDAAESDELTVRRRFRMPDFISIAAVILIAASIAWPVGTHLHRQSIDRGCATNLRRMAVAFDQYAGDFSGAVPIAQAGVFSNWNPTRHNAINLSPLPRVTTRSTSARCSRAATATAVTSGARVTSNPRARATVTSGSSPATPGSGAGTTSR
jgi:hypothetical protein